MNQELEKKLDIMMGKISAIDVKVTTIEEVINILPGIAKKVEKLEDENEDRKRETSALQFAYDRDRGDYEWMKKAQISAPFQWG